MSHITPNIPLQQKLSCEDHYSSSFLIHIPLYIYISHYIYIYIYKGCPVILTERWDGLTAEQKVVIKNLYKYGRRIEHLNSHIEYLSQSLELNLIPSNWPPLMHALDLVNLKRQLLRINTHSCTLTSSPITKTGIIYGQALRI